MGLCNAPATFLILMNEVLEGLVGTFCVVNMDNILICFETADQHFEDGRSALD